MMMLINKYGLSHVCAKPELEETKNSTYPYLDISLTYNVHNFITLATQNIEFYFRGALDQNSRLKNLFEYLLLTSLNGQGFILK